MTKMKISLLVGVLSLSVALAGCSQSPKGVGGMMAKAGEKVATIDGTVVTKQEYDVIFNQYGKMLNIQGNPDSAKNPFIKEALNRLTINKLVLSTFIEKDAPKMGVTVTDADFQKFKEEQVKNVGGRDKLLFYLKQTQMTEKEFDDTLREQLLVNKFIEKKGGESLKVSEKDAKDYYTSHPTEFDIPETIEASHILFKAIEPEMKREIEQKNPKITEAELKTEMDKRKAEQKAKAQNIYAQVSAAPQKFAEIAQKSSDDVVSGQNGGNLGRMVEQAMDPVFWAAIKKTKPGSLYPGVLETQFGYHVIAVKDHYQKHRQSFDEAKMQIMSRMSNEKKQQILQSWFQDRKSKATIKIEPAYQEKQQQTPPQGMMGGAPAPGPGQQGAGTPVGQAPATQPEQAKPH